MNLNRVISVFAGKVEHEYVCIFITDASGICFGNDMPKSKVQGAAICRLNTYSYEGALAIKDTAVIAHTHPCSRVHAT